MLKDDSEVAYPEALGLGEFGHGEDSASSLELEAGKDILLKEERDKLQDQASR